MKETPKIETMYTFISADRGLLMQICSVCIVEMRDAGTLPARIIKVDAGDCESPIHSTLLVPHKFCPVCGKRVVEWANGYKRERYCSEKCAIVDKREKSFSRRMEKLGIAVNCVFCGSSNLIKHGIRHNKLSRSPRLLLCRNCGRLFSFDKSWAKDNAETAKVIISSYLGGDSIKTIQKKLGEAHAVTKKGLEVSYNSIWKCLKRNSCLTLKGKVNEESILPGNVKVKKPIGEWMGTVQPAEVLEVSKK